jgi:hypothetical protein
VVLRPLASATEFCETKNASVKTAQIEKKRKDITVEL